MKIYLPPADDDQSPTVADVHEFACRLQDEREDAARRPAFDDAWIWFLSLFNDRCGTATDNPERRKAA